MIAPASDRATRLAWVLSWALVVVVAAWFRLWQLDIQVLVDDEWHAIHRILHASWRDIFLSFGLADYSIPLTLMFNGLYETIGLSDWRMRLLPLVFGLATIVLVPWLLRPWLDRRERWTLALLLAISPVLVHYARNVRPYALVLLLGFVALIALWHWWRDDNRRWLIAFVPATAISAWLHPLAALFPGAGLVWFSIAGLAHWRSSGDVRRFLQVLAVGLATVAVSAALVLPPLLTTPGAIAEKAGVHSIRFDTLLRAWELIAGTVVQPVAWLVLALAIMGGWRMWRRDRWFLLYWIWVTLFATLVIGLIGPAWIHNALVLVRYEAIFHPFVLALAAIGAVWLATAAARPLLRTQPDWVVWPTGLALAGTLYLAGPLPWLHQGVNQFTNAMRYQADYDLERSIFAYMNDVEVPDFYRQIAEAPGEWQVVEAPWYFETNNSPLMEYQQVHQRPLRIGMISGLCVDWAWGEIPPADRERLVLRPFIYLTDLLKTRSPLNRFVVFHLQRPFDHSRELPEVDECIRAFRERFGAPWHESERQVVFRLPGSGVPGEGGQSSSRQ